MVIIAHFLVALLATANRAISAVRRSWLAGIRKFAVDLAALTKYNDIDLNVTPILVPECGHIQTVESMDGQLTSYLKTMDGIFSCEDPPTCSFCRGNLGSIARYARVVRRSTLDLSTKKLVMWTNRTYVPLAQQLDVCEEQLAKSFDDFVPAALPPHMRAAEMRIAGSRTHFLEAIRRDFKNYMPRYEQIFGLRNSINLFLHRIYEDEASFVKLFELVRAKRMQQSPMVLVDGIPLDSMDLVSNICQVQGDLLGVVLLLRCDLAILTDYLAHQSQQKVRSRVHVDLSADRKECRELWKKIDVREFPRHYTELRILGARFAAIERVFASDVEVDKALFTEASNCLEFASVALEGFPKQTRDLIQDAKMVTAMQSSKMVLYRRDMEPRKAMLAKMAIEADGEGKWYACEKGHPLTLHDEENELEKTKCPTCDGDIVIPENASKTTNGHASA
ncbi:MAG: hypothetical protein M1820_001327 [Bogoriella megaspora]|nr:MAG: hypothetical protein M1820_001327 [Bogoriella megaspora]